MIDYQQLKDSVRDNTDRIVEVKVGEVIDYFTQILSDYANGLAKDFKINYSLNLSNNIPDSTKKEIVQKISKVMEDKGYSPNVKIYYGNGRTFVSFYLEILL